MPDGLSQSTAGELGGFVSALTLQDANFTLTGNSDTTKKLVFQVDTQTTNFTQTFDVGAQTASRSLTWPVLTGNRTLAVIDQAQTFTAAQTFLTKLVYGNATTSNHEIFAADGNDSSSDVRFGLRPLSSTTIAGFRFVTNDTGNAYIDVCTFNSGGTYSAAKTLVLQAGGAGAVNVTNALNVLGSTASSSTSTGALVVSGGLGVAGAAFVGGQLNATGGILTGGVSQVYNASEVTAAASTEGSSRSVLTLFDSTAMAAGVGGGLLFAGKYTSGGAYTYGGGIWLEKANGTDSNFDFNLFLGSRSVASGLVKGLQVSAASSVIVGTAALATNATDGFLYIPTCAGAPSGTPTTQTGRIAMIYDTTNNFFYFYNGGWKKSTVYA